MKTVEVKSISKSTLLPDTYFISKYRCCPYQACMHACKYCDGRSEKYYVEGDFERDIVIRKNLPEVLDAQLAKAREKGIVAFSSGVSDAYQPIEAVEEISRKCGEVVLKHGFPAMVMTKSDLILRDIDLWEAVHKKAGFILLMSLTHLDDEIRKVVEPFAASIDDRLETLKAFKERGMHVGVLAMPMLPYITDTEENYIELYKKLKEINVDVVIPGGLTLRPGINKDTYFEMLKHHYPDQLMKYKKLYGNNNASGAPKNGNMMSMEKQFYDQGFPIRTVHKMYKNAMPLYDEIYILLSHMKLLYSFKGVSVDRLKISIKAYGDWLTERKKYYNRRRQLRFLDLESQVLFMLEGNEMFILLQNQKLTNFLKEMVFNNKIFNYTTLKLEDYEG